MYTRNQAQTVKINPYDKVINNWWRTYYSIWLIDKLIICTNATYCSIGQLSEKTELVSKQKSKLIEDFNHSKNANEYNSTNAIIEDVITFKDVYYIPLTDKLKGIFKLYW